MRTYNYKHFLIDKHEKCSLGRKSIFNKWCWENTKTVKSIDITLKAIDAGSNFMNKISFDQQLRPIIDKEFIDMKSFCTSKKITSQVKWKSSKEESV